MDYILDYSYVRMQLARNVKIEYIYVNVENEGLKKANYMWTSLLEAPVNKKQEADLLEAIVR